MFGSLAVMIHTHWELLSYWMGKFGDVNVPDGPCRFDPHVFTAREQNHKTEDIYKVQYCPKVPDFPNILNLITQHCQECLWSFPKTLFAAWQCLQIHKQDHEETSLVSERTRSSAKDITAPKEPWTEFCLSVIARRGEKILKSSNSDISPKCLEQLVSFVHIHMSTDAAQHELKNVIICIYIINQPT